MNVKTLYTVGIHYVLLTNQICRIRYICPPEKVIDWVLPYSNYQDQLVDQAALMLTLSGRVSETMQVLASQTSFRLRTPDIFIEVSE